MGQAIAIAALLIPAGSAQGDVILQWFESDWQTIERRLPDAFVAGYDCLWVPPPGKADSGGFSVGYDVFDRFNLGSPFDRTLYGTEQDFLRMSSEMDRADVLLYIDTILNHNGFRDSSSPGFEDAGGYPGFVTTLPEDADGDFHGAFEGGDLNGRLAGLIDIAQDKNHQFIRHPVPGFQNLIPNETPREENRQYYPDQDLPEEFGRHPFSLMDPMAGDPTEENATGLLLRYVQWMVETKGVDGFRLDAVKHVPTFFWNDFYDAALFNAGRNPRSNDPFTPFSFGETFTGDFGQLSAYTRKDGFGNRDNLDFPLFFAMRSVFDAGGFGDMRSIVNASFDGSDGNANDGTRGVMFAGSHDEFGPGFFQGYNSVALAHILTRPGFPVVYYNALVFGDGRDFPKGGRDDALGNAVGYGAVDSTIILDLLRINDTHVRGAYANRWEDADVYVYERQNACLVGLNDRGDAGFDERTVQTAFAPGTVLVELTGNAADPVVDPLDADIFNSVTVDGGGQVTIRIPRNSSSENFHGKGYIIYGPEVPQTELSIANSVQSLPADPADGRPEGVRRLVPIDVVTADTIEVTLQSMGGGIDDNALVKLDHGLDLDSDMAVTADGDFAGFESFPSASSTSGGGSGTYSVSIDATVLPEGNHYLESIAFLERDDGPALFDVQRKVVYVDRVPPEVELLFPGRTGDSDITSRSYEFVVGSDATANSVHIIIDPPPADIDVLALVDSGNSARQHDRLEWRSVVDNITDGLHEVAVVAFEQTGNVSVTRFDNIDAELSFPEIEIGVDTNPDPGVSDFQPFPAQILDSVYPNDIVVRVNTQSTPGGAISFGDGDFAVLLSVDGGNPVPAVPFDEALLPPVGILVQNDQNLGDDWDEFRFVWRGYSRGDHLLEATTELADTSRPPTTAIASTTVPESVNGPTITITNPMPPGDTVDNPTEIVVAGVFGDDPEYARVFLDTPDGSEILGTLSNPTTGVFEVTRVVGSYNLTDVLPPNAIVTENGDFVVRVVASTGPNGTGIVSEASSILTITGQISPEPLAQLLPDGDASEMLALPVLAVSAADGPGEGPPADFGEDGTLTELHAGIRDNVLGVALRGDMFGAEENSFDNASFLYIDINAGSTEGATDIATDLNDESDGLRGDISRAAFALDPMIANNGFDLVVGMTEPGIAFGYSLGTDGLGGGFDLFEFRPEFSVSYDSDTGGLPVSPGTSIAGPNAFEIRVPLSALGDPNPGALRFAAVTASDVGFPSPNTLPENMSDEFTSEQTIEELAFFPETPEVLINEILIGDIDVIELFNPGSAAVEISGWALRMNDAAGVSRDFVFSESTVVGAGGYLLVSDEGGVVSPAPVPDTNFAGFNIPWDLSRGASIGLVDEYGVGKDYVDWADLNSTQGNTVSRIVPAGTFFSGDLIAPDATVPHSLARDQNGSDTDTADDWEVTSGVDANAPTPGARNLTTPGFDTDVWMMR